MFSWASRVCISAALFVSAAVAFAQTPVAPPTLAGVFGVPDDGAEAGQPISLTPLLADYTLPKTEDYTFQWRKNGVAIVGATGNQLNFAAVAATDAGTYGVTVSNAAGSSVGTVELTVKPATAPKIVIQPAARTVVVGSAVTFMASASGSYPRTLQWKKDGVAIPGATKQTLTIDPVALSDAGVYSLEVTNALGSATSSAAALTVNAATPPVISADSPGDVTVTEGQNLYWYVYLVGGSPPLKYQWFKNGVAIPGATSASFSLEKVSRTEAGKYHVVATNAGGSATSREATLSVTPATPFTFSTQPDSLTVFQGQSASFYAGGSSSSSPPFTFQWRKNGIAIAGATTNSLHFSAVTFADAADYTLVATNAAGSVTSAVAKLTVSPAVAPTITSQPRSQTVLYGNGLDLQVSVTGTSPITYQWKKNGVVVQGATSYYLNGGADVGATHTYTVEVKNLAGTVTSAPAIVTFSRAVPPRITRQPESVTIAAGMSVSLSLTIDSSGSGQTSVQWRKNGVAISNNYGSYIPFHQVKETDAGDYVAVVTSEGGTVTSASARLSVLPPAPPQMAGYAQDVHARLGEWVTIHGGSSSGGSPPYTYQWFKDGKLLPGATSDSLGIPKVAETDLGVYSLVVSNGGGVASSGPLTLKLYAAADPWVAADRFGDIAYFVAAAPNRIERYDLAAERWLATTTLTDERTPTAMLATTEGVYLAYGRTLVLRSPDLATETAITNTTGDIKRLAALGDLLYYTTSVGSPYNTVYQTEALWRATQLPAFSTTQPVYALTPVPGRALAIATGDTYSTGALVYTLNTDGSLAAIAAQSSGISPLPFASKVFPFPGGDLVASASGTIFRLSDLGYAGSVGAELSDLAFLSDGTPVALRATALQAVDRNGFLVAGEAPVPFVGARVMVRDAALFVFGAPATSGGQFRVAKIAASALAKPAVPAVTVSADERFSIEDAFLSDDGVVHLYSRSKRALVRWSARTRDYLPPLALRGVPASGTHHGASTRALFGYADGQITEVPLHSGTSAERQIGAVSSAINALTDLDDMVLVTTTSNGGRHRVVLDSEARPVFVSRHYGDTIKPVVAWEKNTRRVYSGETWENSLRYEVVPPRAGFSGFIPGPESVANVSLPVRFNPEGTLLASASGRVLNASLGHVGALANNIADAAWLPASLYTVRVKDGETEVQQWSRVSYLLTRTKTLRGTPVRIFRLSDSQLIVVTSNRGFASFTVLNADLSVSTAAPHDIIVADQPDSGWANAGEPVAFSVTGSSASGAVSYRWTHNGVLLPGLEGSAMVVNQVTPATAGIYTATLATSAGSTRSAPAVLGVVTTEKVLGDGVEVGSDIKHPNGNTYDQVLLTGPASTLTANPGQVLRSSYLDLNGDIVQVEFSGAGTLTIVLDAYSPAQLATKYNQPEVRYVQGHAGIVLTGADETTHLSIFSVGRATAVNQALFVDGTDYDGVADVAYVAILSRDGKFGGVRTANAAYVNTRGITGIYAPDVEFKGPVFFGDLEASDAAAPMVRLGLAPTVKLTGGAMDQTNGHVVQVSGISALESVDGTDSHGRRLPAQTPSAQFEQDGIDVTQEILLR